jgi:hypothetical protein
MAVLDDPSCRVCFGHSIDSSRQNSTSEDDKDGDLGKLIRVCACNGSIAFIHEGCLRRWIMVSSNPIDRVLSKIRCRRTVDFVSPLNADFPYPHVESLANLYAYYFLFID